MLYVNILCPDFRKFICIHLILTTFLMFFGVSLIVLVIIILLALISGQEPIPVGQKADARQRRR
ncbi:MAG: hypothetical protein DSY55_05795 [Clostridia bacterium]|nr:MAG: hypothetical protein DSY55_05795 [Clostridia bacterium]